MKSSLPESAELRNDTLATQAPAFLISEVETLEMPDREQRNARGKFLSPSPFQGEGRDGG